MSYYELRFTRDRAHEPETIPFEADDPGMALILAQRRGPNRPAELWRDNRKVCTLMLERIDQSEVWVVGGQRGNAGSVDRMGARQADPQVPGLRQPTSYRRSSR